MTAERCNQVASDHLALAPRVAGSIKPLPISWPVREGGGIAISPAFPADQTIVASGEDGLYRSTDSGATWRRHVSEPVRIARFSPNYSVDHTIFALGASKKTDHASTIHIYRSSDEGATWADQEIAGVEIAKLDKARLVLSPTYAEDRTLYALVFGYVTYSESHQLGVVYRSTDGGSTWSAVQGSGDQLAAPYPYDIALSPDYARDQALVVESMAIGGAVSSGNGLYHSTDGGQTWTRRFDIQSPLFTALVQLPSQQIFGRQQGALMQIKLGATTRSAQDGGWLTQIDVVVSPAYAIDRTLFGIATCSTGTEIRYHLVRASDAIGQSREVLPLGTQAPIFGVALGPTQGYTLVVVSKVGAWLIQLDE
jgi:photosystem II stability/assembly factor-like uncharacterized protein